SAQVCCAGGGAFAPARLMVHEDAIAGLQLRALDALGSLDGRGAWVTAPAGDDDLEFEERLVGSVRLLKRAQLALALPFDQTHRSARGDSETGAGVGDATVSARWDFIYAAESERAPGVALTAGLIAPTGRAPESETL